MTESKTDPTNISDEEGSFAASRPCYKLDERRYIAASIHPIRNPNPSQNPNQNRSNEADAVALPNRLIQSNDRITLTGESPGETRIAFEGARYASRTTGQLS
jgi:hypothetical protein